MERKCLKNSSTWKTHTNSLCVVSEQRNRLNKTCPDAEKISTYTYCSSPGMETQLTSAATNRNSRNLTKIGKNTSKNEEHTPNHPFPSFRSPTLGEHLKLPKATQLLSQLLLLQLSPEVVPGQPLPSRGCSQGQGRVPKGREEFPSPQIPGRATAAAPHWGRAGQGEVAGAEPARCFLTMQQIPLSRGKGSGFPDAAGACP